jgi:hypothetical protein
MRNTLYLSGEPPQPTQAEELLFKFVLVGPTTITYMGQHARGRAYIDDLQEIFDGACRHLIARQKQGVNFSHLMPARRDFTSQDSAPAIAENTKESEAIPIEK